MFKRILKTLVALGAGHGVQTLTQLLLPPAFIAVYGVQGYGEWLALSAAVGYLGTLDFGLQTYVLNHLTALYHRRELDEFHRVQSVGLWLTVGFVALGSLVASLAFIAPIARWLRISGNPSAASWTVFWLSLQILASIPMGQVFGIYRTFGQAHRGVMWGNAYRATTLIATVVMAWMRATFWLIALAQFFVAAGALLAAFWWIRRSQPELHPRLNYWRTDLAWQILKPSAFFGLFMFNNFLVYQGPLLLLQRFLGAHAVVTFSVARTLFSFVRQGAGLLQQAIAPEITRLHGIGDRAKLVRVYTLFESVLFSGVLILNTGLLLLAPAVLAFWLKRPQLFDFWVFVLVMLVSILACVKEYKLYFQCATNNHVRTGLATSSTYGLMVLASIPAIHWAGINGFILAWICAEAIQVLLIHSYNREFFAGRCEISLKPALRGGLALGVLVVLIAAGRSLLQSQGYWVQSLLAALTVILVTGLSYFLFGLKAPLRECTPRLAHLWKLDVP
jgi:O-antigen/teichoic acid export membrane protein